MVSFSECSCGTHGISAALDKDRPILTKCHIRTHCGWGGEAYLKFATNFDVFKGRVKKKIVEFSIKVGGWGQQWTDFQLSLFTYFSF